MSREDGYAELDGGVQLLTLGDGAAARDAFVGALEDAETPEAHDGLARALWWLGLPDEAIEHRERAFVLWKKRGDERKAGGAAVWLAREHLAVYGNDAVANGWLARAERLLLDLRTVDWGWLELARGKRVEDPSSVIAARAGPTRSQPPWVTWISRWRRLPN